jgi:carbonic anhydrase
MIEGAPAEARDFVEPWMSMAAAVLPRIPADASLEERLALCETEVVRLTLANLRTFPWVAEAVDQGRLALHGCRFGIANGVLERLGRDGFAPVT